MDRWTLRKKEEGEDELGNTSTMPMSSLWTPKLEINYRLWIQYCKEEEKSWRRMLCYIC